MSLNAKLVWIENCIIRFQSILNIFAKIHFRNEDLGNNNEVLKFLLERAKHSVEFALKLFLFIKLDEECLDKRENDNDKRDSKKKKFYEMMTNQLNQIIVNF